MKFNKILSVGLACAMTIACVSGCGSNKEKEDSDGKVTISVGLWPQKGTDAYNTKMEQVARFEEMYPDIKVVGDTYEYKTDTFIAKASGGTLPTIISTWFTEVDKIVDGGYVADLTDILGEAGWLEQMNPDIVKYVSADDGKVYGIPYNVYAQGMYINKSLFEQAGLVDENGDVIIPKTYDDVYEASKTIKEKTGKAGFGLPTIKNNGGWHTINVAWAYGADFLNRSEDGKYTSIMNTPETIEAYEWVKKMRAANVFPDNPNLVVDDIMPLFGTGQVAMFFSPPAYISNLATSYGMNPEDIIVASMPEGPNGRMSQMGGDLYMIAKNATPEQIDAALKWIDFIGHGPTLDDVRVQNSKESYKTTIEKGGVVLPKDPFYLWISEERMQKLLDARKEYANIPEENLEEYYAFEDVTLMPEPEACCQELYAELDKVVQEIFANSDADVAKLVKAASDNWQVNSLDNLK